MQASPSHRSVKQESVLCLLLQTMLKEETNV